jgi:hypothetical protein
MNEKDLELAIINAQRNKSIVSDSEGAAVGCFSCLPLGKGKAPRKIDRTQIETQHQISLPFPSEIRYRHGDSAPAQTKEKRSISRSNAETRSSFSVSGPRKRVSFSEQEKSSIVVQTLAAKSVLVCSAESAIESPQSTTLSRKCPARLELQDGDALIPPMSFIHDPVNGNKKLSSISQLPSCQQVIRASSLASPVQSPSTVEELVQHWAASFKVAPSHETEVQPELLTMRSSTSDEGTLFFL